MAASSKVYADGLREYVFAAHSKQDTLELQSTLVISTSVISNNRLSRRENLFPVLT